MFNGDLTSMTTAIWAKMRLDGYTALVTGAGKGLGRSIAIGLAQAGANLALLSRTEKDLDVVAREVRQEGVEAMSVVADATDANQITNAVEQVVKRFGRLDVLVHSAGSSQPKKPVLELSNEEWSRLIGANLDSTFFVCKAVGKVMIAQGRGSIINIASVAGQRGRPGNAAYSAAKAGVINFSRALAMEWATHGVRVNTLAPGRFLTPLTEAEMSDPQKHEEWIKKVPLGRLGKPEEVREIVVWLASEASSFVTGSTLVIDGGITLQ